MSSKTKKRRSHAAHTRPEGRTKTLRSVAGRVLRFTGSGFLRVGAVIFVVSGVSVLFLGIYQSLVDSPHIRLEKIDMRGVDDALREELLRMGGLDADLSLVAVRLNEVKRKMEAHPWVRAVKVERHFPHTLVIDAEMERPWALVLLDRPHYMNRWGEVFKAVGGSDDVDYPLVTGVPPDGAHRDVLLKRAANVLEIFAAEKPPWSLGDLSEVSVSPSGNISLYFHHLRAEVTFVWRNPENRLSELKRVVGHLRQTGRLQEARRFDFDYVNGAVVSFRNGYEPTSG